MVKFVAAMRVLHQSRGPGLAGIECLAFPGQYLRPRQQVHVKERKCYYCWKHSFREIYFLSHCCHCCQNSCLLIHPADPPESVLAQQSSNFATPKACAVNECTSHNSAGRHCDGSPTTAMTPLYHYCYCYLRYRHHCHYYYCCYCCHLNKRSTCCYCYC